jgi:hypothetical protein
MNQAAPNSMARLPLVSSTARCSGETPWGKAGELLHGRTPLSVNPVPESLDVYWPAGIICGRRTAWADRSDGPPRHPTGHRLYKRARYRPAVDTVLDKFALVVRATAPSTRREATICPGVVPAIARNSRLRCA